jgi:hypothetical protein
MYLLNIDTEKLEQFVANAPEYGILSHTWDNEEVLFADMQMSTKVRVRTRRTPDGHSDLKRGYRKIDFVCRQARAANLKYAWIDTCCIDKSSSAELSEAINSMFLYYEAAVVCWVLLIDFTLNVTFMRSDGKAAPNPVMNGSAMLYGSAYETFEDTLGRSRWFQRGWCLQELLAPRRLIFYNSDSYETGSGPIASLSQIVNVVSRITKIDSAVLLHNKPLHKVSVAERMSWAANRQTTRIEDGAYSLLGIFNVHMPMLYGEGQRAFRRLQEEILRSSTDLSIFAWELREPEEEHVLLAPSPRNFASNERIVSFVGGSRAGSYHLANHGLEVSLLVTAINRESDGNGGEMLAILDCGYEAQMDTVLCLHLAYPQDTRLGDNRPWECYIKPSRPNDSEASRLTSLSVDVLANAVRRSLVISTNAESGDNQSDERFLVWFRPSGLLGHSCLAFGTQVRWDHRGSMLIFERWVGDCEAGVAFSPADNVWVLVVVGVTVDPSDVRGATFPRFLGLVISFGQQKIVDLRRQWSTERRRLLQSFGSNASTRVVPDLTCSRRWFLTGRVSYRVNVTTRPQVIRNCKTLMVHIETESLTDDLDLEQEAQFLGHSSLISRTGDIFSECRVSQDEAARREQQDCILPPEHIMPNVVAGENVPLTGQATHVAVETGEEFWIKQEARQESDTPQSGPNWAETAAVASLLPQVTTKWTKSDMVTRAQSMRKKRELAMALREKMTIDE